MRQSIDASPEIEPPDLPQWEQDSRKRVREIRESDDWLEVLTRMDLDEFRIMKKFALNARPSVSKSLFQALDGRGAFRRFRDEIHRIGHPSRVVGVPLRMD